MLAADQADLAEGAASQLETIVSTMMYFAVLSVIAVCLSASAHALGARQLVVTRQDNSSTGFVEKYDPATGMVETQAKTNFVFSWPHVEMTSGANTNEVYVVTFPAGYPGPVLYRMDSDLNMIYSWVNTPFTFFDLQYSPKQDAMYGILVTTTYGRVLSNFTLDQQADTITPTQLYTLPYMWYVNASSFDAENSRYFALINNFPGFENSTLEQQLIVADFSKNIADAQPDVGLFQISSGEMLVQFVTYSASLRTLFCAGTSRGSAVVAVLDQKTGEVTRKVFQKKATAVGPLMYVPGAGGRDQLTVYVQTATNPAPVWELWSLSLQLPSEGDMFSAVKVATYEGGDFRSFAGATVTK